MSSGSTRQRGSQVLTPPRRPTKYERHRAKLLLCGPLPPPHSGQSVCFSHLVAALEAQGECRTLLLNNAPGPDWRPGRVNFPRLWGICRLLAQALVRLPRVDLLYITIAQSPAGFLRDAMLVWAARLLGKRVVARVDGGAFHRLYQGQGASFRKFLSATVRQVQRFLVLSDTIYRDFAAVPCLAERMQVVPNGVIVPPDAAPKSLPKEGHVRVLFLSNLIVEKGYQDLLEAARWLKVHRPDLDLRYEFAGAFILDGDYFSSIEAARRDFWRRVQDGLEGVVTYHGVVAGQRKEDLLRQCHLFVLPTYYRYEGQPLSVLEAMAHALPIITTPWAALPEMVSDRESGYLVPPRDPEALAEAIVKVVEDPKRYRRLSEAALARVQEEYTMERHIGQMVEAFRSLLENGATP